MGKRKKKKRDKTSLNLVQRAGGNGVMEIFDKYKTKHSRRQKPSMENWSPVKVWQNPKWRNIYSILFCSDPKKLPDVSSSLGKEVRGEDSPRCMTGR